MSGNIADNSARHHLTTANSLPRERVAVLPFVNMSPDAADEYLADGMTEELIDKLAQSSGLRVLARTTMMQYKNGGEKASEVGRELHVGTVVEGSLRKFGSKVRVTAQLIDAETEEHIWSQSYDKELGDVFGIQSDIAENVRQAVLAKLSPILTLENNPPRQQNHAEETRDLSSYTLFLQARKLSREKKSAEAVKEALTLFQKSIELDPKFARAYVGVADCHAWLGNDGSEPYLESLSRAKEALEKALQINPSLAEAHSMLSAIYLGEDKLDNSETEAERAIELNQNLARPYRVLAQIRGGEGNAEEMVRLLEHAYVVDPLDLNVVAFLGHAYMYVGRERDALEHFEKTMELIPYRINAHLAEYHMSRGEFVFAEAEIKEMKRLRPSNPWTIAYEGVLAALRDDEQAARRSIEELSKDSSNALNTFLTGFVHYAIGQLEPFYDSMREASRMHSAPVLELIYSPLFAAARQDKEYQQMLSDIRHKGLGDESNEKSLPVLHLVPKFPRQVGAHDECELTFDIINSGKTEASLIMLEGVLPRALEFKGLKISEVSSITFDPEINAINFRGRKLSPFEVLFVSIAARLLAAEIGEFSPVLCYSEPETGKLLTTTSPPIRIEIVREKEDFTFKNDGSAKIFDLLVKSFITDYALKKLHPDASGWLSIGEIAAQSGITRSSLYGRNGGVGIVPEELIRRGLVEARIFPNQRGRRGEATRLRVNFDIEPIREHVLSQIRRPD